MSKKCLGSLLLALALLLSLGAAAGAEAQLDYVSDYAGILSDAQRQTLNDQAAQLSARYDCGVYVVIVGDYTEFVRGGIENFSEEVFERYELGTGDSHDGVLLAMSMDGRDYDLYAHGDFGNYAFTDYGKRQLAESFLDNFRRSDWAGGFADYLTNSGELLRLARNGQPVDQWVPDQDTEASSRVIMNLVISLLIGCVVGGASVSGFKRKMKTAVRQTRAGAYVSRGGVDLRVRKDDFINRTVSRQIIRREDPANRPGGHPGGTTISGSHGGSHHSGKF